ncbi:transposase [Sphaerotilus sp.]|uniref:transposase n=1 Tax=Sphaerotilus sp. TaxID=2093942 RepID=UPI00286DF397|nr:transposase [Sphaerotilus sp.]
MARLPRLAIAGLVHHVIQRGHNRQAVFLDDHDRSTYLTALREAAALQRVAVHAYVLMDDHVHLLVTPPTAEALSKMLQAIGRRYVSAFNRRHGRVGTLWDGRFRATVLESGPHVLTCMRYIEQNPQRLIPPTAATDYPWSSAPHHLGKRRDPLLTDHALYWATGNTPFEREMAWRRLLDEPLSGDEIQAHTDSALKGWALGSGAFLASLGAATERPMAPRPRGRPARAPRQGVSADV